MLEHPEITWIQRTGYPSWMQERGPWLPEEKEDEQWIRENPSGS